MSAPVITTKLDELAEAVRLVKERVTMLEGQVTALLDQQAGTAESVMTLTEEQADTRRQTSRLEVVLTRLQASMVKVEGHVKQEDKRWASIAGRLDAIGDAVGAKGALDEEGD